MPRRRTPPTAQPATVPTAEQLQAAQAHPVWATLAGCLRLDDGVLLERAEQACLAAALGAAWGMDARVAATLLTPFLAPLVVGSSLRVLYDAQRVLLLALLDAMSSQEALLE